MKNIFVYIASPLRKKSNTYRLTRKVLDCLVEMDKNIRYEIFTAGDVRVDFCIGCWSCAMGGNCPQDKKDDLPMLKKKMLEADCIIYGSPIYNFRISAQMKAFVDRMGAWTYFNVLKMAHKPGVTVITSGCMPTEQEHEYLDMSMTAMKVVARLEGVGYLPGKLEMTEEMKRKARETAEAIYPYLSGEKQVETDEKMEAQFQEITGTLKGYLEMLRGISDFWREKGLLDMTSYSELLELSRMVDARV